MVNGRKKVFEQHDSMKVAREPWPKDFPQLFKFATIDDRNNNKHYMPAKKQASMEDALALVRDLIPLEKIEELKEKYGDKNPVLMPVHAFEITGEGLNGTSNIKKGLSENYIPLAMAIYLSAHTGWDVETNIVQSNVAGRTGSNGFERFAFPARFDGKVQEGRNYIILDDHVSMAGTVASAKGHVEKMADMS